MNSKYKLVVCLLFIFNFSLKAQENIPLGVWRTHFSYHSITSLAIKEEQIFSGSSNGLFFYDNEFNSSHIQSKITGFSDVSIEKIKYAPEASALIIAYKDGNIDLLKDGKIINVNALKNARVNSDKKINDINLHHSSAFVSTTFGLALLDLARNEIKEIYQNIGAGAGMLNVYSSTIYEESIYISTSEGLKYASLNPNINLQDYNSWKDLTTNGLPSKEIRYIINYNNNLYVGLNTEGIFKLENDNWSKSEYPAGSILRSFSISSNTLFVCLDNFILKITPSSFEQILHPTIVTPFDAAIDNSGTLWIADSTSGLLKYSSNGIEQIIPNGPFSTETQRLQYINNRIISLPGGFSNNGRAKHNLNGFSSFQQGLWNNFNSFQNTTSHYIPPFKDILSIAYDEQNQRWWLGSFQDGLLKMDGDNTTTVFNDKNSNLNSDSGFPEAVRITDLKMDQDNSLWILNYNVSEGNPSLHEKKEDETWVSYIIDHPYASIAHQLEIDYFGQKWLRVNPEVNNGGVLVFDPATGRVRQLNTIFGSGGLANAQVNDMIFDKEGTLWLATNNGVSFLYRSYDVFDNNVDATRPIVDNQYLLRDTKVNCMDIDGGGRKWMGTNDGGAWLFNSDASEVILHFTTANSPLPSNRIVDLVVNQRTGEVFFATDKGTVSFKADATKAEPTLSKVKVFPNPILPNFNGTVGISGLVENSAVKITDVSGRLVYSAKSNGGTASWNIGNRSLRTGVYYVFSISESGEEKLVSKFAVVE